VYNVSIIDDNKMVSLRVIPKFMHYNFACFVCGEGHNLYLVPSTVRLGCCVILKFGPSHIYELRGIRVMACERARMPELCETPPVRTEQQPNGNSNAAEICGLA
jgi:hypothetical protein